MNLFYAMMNPDKLALVPKLARKFAKQDKMLSAELQKNYNGLDLSSNLETLLKEAKVEKELAGLMEQLTEERKKRAQLEESLLAKSMERVDGERLCYDLYQSNTKVETLQQALKTSMDRLEQVENELRAANQAIDLSRQEVYEV